MSSMEIANMELLQRGDPTPQQDIEHLAEQRDVARLCAVLDIVEKNPDTIVAAQLEVVGLKVLGGDFFGRAKTSIRTLDANKPAFESLPVRDAVHTLSEYESEVVDYLHQHTAAWHRLVGSKRLSRSEKRTFTLHMLGEHLKSKKSLDSSEYTFDQLGKIQLLEIDMNSSDELREKIATTAQDITELTWEAVQIGRDTQADLIEGYSVWQRSNIYAGATRRTYETAYDFADREEKRIHQTTKGKR